MTFWRSLFSPPSQQSASLRSAQITLIIFSKYNKKAILFEEFIDYISLWLDLAAITDWIDKGLDYLGQ